MLKEVLPRAKRTKIGNGRRPLQHCVIAPHLTRPQQNRVDTFNRPFAMLSLWSQLFRRDDSPRDPTAI